MKKCVSFSIKIKKLFIGISISLTSKGEALLYCPVLFDGAGVFLLYVILYFLLFHNKKPCSLPFGPTKKETGFYLVNSPL